MVLVPQIALSIVFMLLPAGGGTDPAPQDTLFGWSWGTPRETIARHQQLEPLPGGEGEVRRYRTELAIFGEAKLGDCDFEFVGGKFAGVIMMTRTRADSHALLRELRRLYGPGQGTDPRGVGWLTATTHARYDEGNAGDAYVYIYAVRLQAAPVTGGPERTH